MSLCSRAHSCVILCQQQLVMVTNKTCSNTNFQSLTAVDCHLLSQQFSLSASFIKLIVYSVRIVLHSSELQRLVGGIKKQMRQNHYSTSESFHKVCNLQVVHKNLLLIITSPISMGFNCKLSFMTGISANTHQFFFKFVQLKEMTTSKTTFYFVTFCTVVRNKCCLA